MQTMWIRQFDGSIHALLNSHWCILWKRENNVGLPVARLRYSSFGHEPDDVLLDDEAVERWDARHIRVKGKVETPVLAETGEY